MLSRARARRLGNWTNCLLAPTFQGRSSLVACRSGSGFSLLELVVVIAIISLLLVFAITRLWPLQAEAERVAMEQVVGGLRSALGIKVASYMVQNDMAGIRELIDTNPMDRLSEVPNNYRGALSGRDNVSIEGGTWYFDVPGKVLVYRVRNQDYFRGGIGQPAQVRFAIRVVYEERGRRTNGETSKNEIAGAMLVALDPYEWVITTQ